MCMDMGVAVDGSWYIEMGGGLIVLVLKGRGQAYRSTSSPRSFSMLTVVRWK